MATEKKQGRKPKPATEKAALLAKNLEKVLTELEAELRQAKDERLNDGLTMSLEGALVELAKVQGLTEQLVKMCDIAYAAMQMAEILRDSNKRRAARERREQKVDPKPAREAAPATAKGNQ